MKRDDFTNIVFGLILFWLTFAAWKSSKLISQSVDVLVIHHAKIATLERQIADLRQERITRALPESKEIKFTAP